MFILYAAVFFFVIIIISKHNIVHNIIKKGKQKHQQNIKKRNIADIKYINEKLKKKYIKLNQKINIKKKQREKFVLGRKAERHDLSHSNLH